VEAQMILTAEKDAAGRMTFRTGNNDGFHMPTLGSMTAAEAWVCLAQLGGFLDRAQSIEDRQKKERTEQRSD
jgi:hypothetical protein